MRRWPWAALAHSDAQQKKQLTEQFTTPLVRTYSGALNPIPRPARSRLQAAARRPARDRRHREDRDRPAGPGAGADRLQMRKDGNESKVYDVIVGGVSLVTNYRDEFASQIQSGGIDGLIKSLKAKNAPGAAGECDPSVRGSSGGFVATPRRLEVRRRADDATRRPRLRWRALPPPPATGTRRPRRPGARRLGRAGRRAWS